MRRKGDAVFENSKVIVLCYEDQVEPGIARALLKHQWRLIDGRSATPAIKIVMLAQPCAVIVQIPQGAEPATGLIAKLSRHWNPVRVLAVAGRGAGEAEELLVRQSGAACFLPHPCAFEMLETTIEHMVPGVTREGSGEPVRRSATGTTGRSSASHPGAYSRRASRTL